MSDLIFAGGTVVTAEASFPADVAVSGETIEAVGVDLPRDGAEVVDCAGARVMPGFIDGHTHMDMPFGGTVTADDWDTGTAAAVAGGTTMLVDFSLQDVDGTLGEAVETWQGKAEKSRIDYGLHVAITNLTDEVKQELPTLPELGVATVKIFMAYKGTPLYTADEDLFEAMQIARECGLLVLVHAENGDAIAKLQAQALARGDTEPRWHGLTRPEAVEAEATNRAIRLAEIADCPLLVVHVSCADALAADRARARARPDRLRRDLRPVLRVLRRGPRAPRLRGRQVRLLAAAARPVEPAGAVARPAGGRPADLRLRPLLVQLRRPEGARRATTSRRSRTGCPASRSARRCCGRTACARGRSRRTCSSPRVSTNQARVHGMAGRKGTLAPGADADIVVWDPDMTVTATQSNRHGNVDYTPYEGMTFTGGPAAVYVRGELAYRDGEVIAEPGSGRFVHRTFARPAPGPAVR